MRLLSAKRVAFGSALIALLIVGCFALQPERTITMTLRNFVTNTYFTPRWDGTTNYYYAVIDGTNHSSRSFRCSAQEHWSQKATRHLNDSQWGLNERVKPDASPDTS